MTKKVVISVIISCYNGEKYIKGCINSVLKSDFNHFEIIIINDGSTDNSKKVLQFYQHHPLIKIIHLSKNLGPSKARNQGVSVSCGQYIFFLDIDTQIKIDCLKQIASTLKHNPNIGALQAKILQGKSHIIDSIGHFISYSGFPYEIGHGEQKKNHNRMIPIFGAKSAALAIRKQVFEETGGFDEDYLIYGEDTDLSWRVWLAGYRMYYLPKAEVDHFQKSSLTNQTKHRIFYEGAKNNTNYLLKNASFKTLVWMLPLHILTWLIIGLKLILQKHFQMALWLYYGLWWNIKNLPKTLRKRKSVIKDNKFMFGPLTVWQLFPKGLKWLLQI